jgi:hypothetical protein
MTVTLTNLTNPTDPTDPDFFAHLTEFGFNTDPNANGVQLSNQSDNSTPSWHATLDQTFAGEPQVDICLWTATSCAGGLSDWLGPTQSLNFALTLTFDNPIPIAGVDLGFNLKSVADPFYVAFQTDDASYEFKQKSVQVPEPLSAALLGTGFLALGIIRRRQSSTSAALAYQ